MRKVPTYLLLLLVIGISCSKEEEKNSCEITSETIVGTYKIISITYKEHATSKENELVATFGDCEKDDLVVFGKNGQYSFVDAGLKCSPANDNNLVWSLNGKTLLIGTEETTIESFDCKTLVLVHTGDDYYDDVTTSTFQKL